MANELHERVARALREEPPELDDLSRARLERAIVSAAGRDLLAPPPSPRRRATKGLMVAVTITAAAAAVGLGVWLGTTARTPAGSTDPFASGGMPKELMEASLVAEGVPAQGETLRTGSGQRMRARVASSEVELEPNTRARFERMAPEELRVRLHAGAVRVAFHPQLDSRQRMVVATEAARVEVVGTVFRVEVDGAGATGVWVDRGEVRVVPAAEGAKATVVGAGESTRVAHDGRIARASGGPAAEPEAAGSEQDGSADPEAPAQGATAQAGDSSRDEDSEAGDPSTREGGPARQPRKQARASARRTEGTPDRHVRGQVRLPGGDHLPAFARARRLLNRQRYDAARDELRELAASDDHDRSIRTRAWVMIAESHEEQRQYSRAAEAYGKASWFGARTRAGLRALFMLGQLREGRLGDTHGARNAYRRYLREAPHGPHAAEVRQALCRLGERDACY